MDINTKNIAIIPARCGSKGIPLKNIYQINNKPLIQYSMMKGSVNFHSLLKRVKITVIL